MQTKRVDNLAEKIGAKILLAPGEGNHCRFPYRIKSSEKKWRNFCCHATTVKVFSIYIPQEVVSL